MYMMQFIAAHDDCAHVVKVVTSSFLLYVTIFPFVVSMLWQGTLRLCKYSVSNQIRINFSIHQWFLPVTIITEVFA